MSALRVNYHSKRIRKSKHVTDNEWKDLLSSSLPPHLRLRPEYKLFNTALVAARLTENADLQRIADCRISKAKLQQHYRAIVQALANDKVSDVFTRQMQQKYDLSPSADVAIIHGHQFKPDLFGYF